MQRGLKELLIDDYLDFDEQSIDSDDFPRKNRHDEKTAHVYLQQLLDHSFFDYLMAVVVISSSITLGLSLETDEDYLNDHWRQTAIYACDEILIALLFLEFLAKFYFQGKNFWFNWTNLYDFIILLFGFIEILWTFFSAKSNSTVSNVLKGFRLLQLIRFYRIINLSEGLRVLTKALVRTVITYTFSVTILVFLYVYIIAVAGQILYGKSEESPWHYFPTSMIIAMRLILVDNWNIIAPQLEHNGSPPISRWFLVIIVFIGNRIVTNVLVGLMIESVSSANDDYIKEKREKKIRRHQKKREALSKRTFQVLNTRLSDPTTTENPLEQMRSKLKLIQNELISPDDVIFSFEWLEKLVRSSEKIHGEARSSRHLITQLIQSLADVAEENIRRNEHDK